MIFRFARKKFSDVVKVVQFLDKEGIEYEVMADIEVAINGGLPVGSQPTVAGSTPVVVDPDSAPPHRDITPITADPDPAWRPARHAGDCGGKGVCTDGTHYGMIVE